MSAISWKYNTDGVWSNAANWSGGVLPGAADDVTLATLSPHTITYSSASGTTQIHSLSATTDSLNVSGGTLAILATASFGKTLTMSGGTLSFLGTSESVSGSLAAVNGQILLSSGNVFTVSGATSIAGTTYGGTGPYLDGPGTFSTLGTTHISQTASGGYYVAMVLGGGITWQIGATVLDAGQIDTGDSAGGSATIINAAGLNFDFTTDNAGIVNNSYYNNFGNYVTGSSSFSNAGTFAKTGGTLTSHVDSVVTNTGLLSAATGTIEFDDGGSFGGTLAGAGTLAFGGGVASLTSSAISVGNLLFDGAAATLTAPLSTTGSVTLSAGTLTLNGKANSFAHFTEESSNNTLILNGDSLALQNAYLGSGDLIGTGTLTTGGTTTLAGWNGNYTYSFNGGIAWTNTGTVNQVYSVYQSGTGFSLTNVAGAVYDMAGDYFLSNGVAGSVGSSFANAGLLEKTVGTATNEVALAFTNTSTGTIAVASGTIEFDGGGSFAGTLSGAGTISFGTGTDSLANGVSIGVSEILVDGGTITLGGNETYTAAQIYENYGSIQLAGHTLTATSAFLGNGTIDGAGLLSLSGTSTLSSGNVLSLGGGLQLTNAGVVNQNYYLYVDTNIAGAFAITNAAGATWNINGNGDIGDGGTGATFTNLGIFDKAGGTGVSDINAVFSTASTLIATSGVLQFNDGGTFNGLLSGSGTIALAGGTGSLGAGGANLKVATLLLDGMSVSLNTNLTVASTTSFILDSSAPLTIGIYNLSLTNSDLSYGLVVGSGTLTTAGTTTIGNYNYIELGGGLHWNNTGIVNADYYVYDDYLTGSGFALTNAATGTYNIEGDFGIGGNNSNGVTSTISNAGKFIKAVGGGTSQVISTFTNTSTGTVTAASTGNIEFDGGGTFSGSLTGTGSISFASTVTLNAGLSISVANLNIYNNGNVTLAGNLSYAGDLTFNSGVLYLNNHTLTLASPTLSGGTIDGPGTLSLTGTTALGANSFYFGGSASITNSGTVDQNGNVYVSYQSGSGFSVNNLAGATWDQTNTYYVGANNQNGTSSTFANAGTFTQTGGNTYSLIYSVFNNASTGTVSVNSGAASEIAFEAGGTFAGTFDGTGLISFQNSTYFLGGLTETASATTEFYESTIDLTGAVTMNGTLVANGNPSTINLGGNQLSLATLNLAHTGATQYFEQAGTLSTTGTGSIVDWYSNGPMISFAAGATWVNSGTMLDGGLVQLADTTVVNGASTGTLVNTAGAVFAFTSDDAGIRAGSNNASAFTAILTNAGLLEKTGGTGTSNVNATLTSTGTLATTSGTLAFDEGGSVAGKIAASSSIAFNGGSFGFGALTIGGGAAVSNATTITQTGALTLGDSSNISAGITNTGTYLIAADVGIASAGSATSIFTNAGLLEKTAATGRSVITPAVLNSGTIIAASGTLALTGSVTGTGSMLIGAGDTLELGGAIAASQSVSYTSATGTLRLDTPATAAETVYNLVVGNVIDVAGITATKATVNANDQLVIANGTTTVATVQLSGSYLIDTFTVASDGNGGEKVTLTAANTAWKGSNADWFGTNVWTNGPPNAQTAATIALSTSYTMTLNGGETGAASTVGLTGTQADFILNGTLNITKSFTASAGTLAVGGTINGGIFVSNGSTVSFTGGTLSNLAYRGLIDLSPNYANVYLAGTDSFAGATGTGTGTINLTGYQTTLFAEGYETLNNVQVNFGSSTSGTAFLRSLDTNGQGAILTIGPTGTLTHAGANAALSDSGNAYDAVYNDGKIVASLAAGTFTVTGNDFENDGTITVSNGDMFNVQSAQFVNTKTLTVSGATLGISGAFLNTGSATATNSVLNFATSLTGTGLTAIVTGGGDTLNLSGSLDEQGGTLAVGSGAKITSLHLSGDILNATINPTAGAFTFSNGSTLDNDSFNGTISVGGTASVTILDTLSNAVIADSGGGVLFGQESELNKVSYDGTLSLLPGNAVEILGGLTLAGAGGTGVGAMSANAGTIASTLYMLDTETLSNVVITSGAGAGPGTLGLFLSPSVAAGGTLTLASTTSFDVVAGTTAGFLSDNPTTGAALNNRIVNNGLISVGAGGTFLGSDGSVAGFTNAGSIALATGADWLASGTAQTSATFTNTAAGTISLGTTSTLQTNGGMVNAGHIALATGALVTVQGSFSETGTTTVAAGASFDINGTTTLASLASVSGAGTLGLNGPLNLAGATFDMAAAGRTTNVEIGGNLQSGTFSNDAGTVTFGTLATLTSMTWKGPLSIGPGSTVDVVGNLVVQTVSGGTPGVVTLTGNASAGATLTYAATALSNLTFNSSSMASSSAGIANILSIGAAAGTLTLGVSCTLNATAGATELMDAATSGTAAGKLINNGHINVTGGALWIDPSFTSVSNTATIALSADTEVDATPGATATNQLFTNTGLVSMVSLDDFDLLGSGANSGRMSILGGSEASFGANFTNTGSITLSNGSSLTAGGTMIAAGGTITASGSSSDFVTATAGTATAFYGGTLTGGIWTVSAASTLTLNWGSVLTTDAADIVLNGANSVLRSVGTTIARLESTLATIATGGTLAVLGGRGYSTTLALADQGTLQLGGGTLTTGGLSVAASALLTGFGTVTGSIANAGTLDASGGTLTLSGAVTGAGILQIESGAELEIGTANGETVLFQAGADELRLDTPASFTGTLSGFAAGDSILLMSTSATAAVLSGSTLTVSLSGGTQDVFKVAGNSATVTLTTASDGSGDTLLSYPTSGAVHASGGTGAPIRFIAPGATATAVPALATNDQMLPDFAAPLAGVSNPASSGSGVATSDLSPATASLLVDHSHAIGATHGAMLIAGRA
jgi:fibronectin-binding autotransporter adhesin